MTPPLLSAFVRSLFVQASFNYDRMIGVGTAMIMRPMVSNMGPEVASRAVQFFNAHPYLAGMAATALARAERDEAPPEQIDALRNALSGRSGPSEIV